MSELAAFALGIFVGTLLTVVGIGSKIVAWLTDPEDE